MQRIKIVFVVIFIVSCARSVEPTVENINKIFTPFFSTKSKSEGTGLGLTITKAIIARHKGKIEVVSNPGEGTIFNIFLPFNDKGRNKEI